MNNNKRNTLIIFSTIILIMLIILLLRSANDSATQPASGSTQDDFVVVTTEARTEEDSGAAISLETTEAGSVQEETFDNTEEAYEDTEDTSEDSGDNAYDDADDEEEYTFRNDKLLNSHYDKHGRDMGFDSPEDYEEAASDVVNNPDALHKTEKEDGDDVYYVKKTNEFVIVSPDGYIRTYFNPSDGINYYNRQ